jgi:quercetin dioxygenase-like cupin family protein
MITKGDLAAAEQSVEPKHDTIPLARPAATNRDHRGRDWWRLGGAALVAALAIGLVCSGEALGQASALQIIPLAQGFSREHHVNLHSKGPSDALQSLLVFQPGGDTGWHTHPGPVVVVVKSGALTEFHSNGCTSVHPAGSVFFETKDEVHRAVNQTGDVTEVYATFISPAGTQPLIPATDPGGVCRQPEE